MTRTPKPGFRIVQEGFLDFDQQVPHLVEVPIEPEDESPGNGSKGTTLVSSDEAKQAIWDAIRRAS